MSSSLYCFPLAKDFLQRVRVHYNSPPDMRDLLKQAGGVYYLYSRDDVSQLEVVSDLLSVAVDIRDLDGKVAVLVHQDDGDAIAKACKVLEVDVVTNESDSINVDVLVMPDITPALFARLDDIVRKVPKYTVLVGASVY